MKLCKKFMSMLVCAVMLAAMTSSVLAVEIHELSPTPPTEYTDSLTRGKTPPDDSTGFVNLANKNYSYTVKSVGAQVYTDKWLYGVDRIKVTVNNYRRIDDPDDHRSYDGVTVKVYDSNDDLVDYAFVDCSTQPYSGSCKLDTPSGDFYVEFSPVRDYYLYAFSGVISGE